MLLHAQLSYTQLQLPVYSDYLTENYFLVHPAMAGAQLEGLQVRMTHRAQWKGVANAPNLQTVNAHGRIGLKSGLGTVLYFINKLDFPLLMHITSILYLEIEIFTNCHLDYR